MTRDEVESLNIHARNITKARRDESGMDWDYWAYYPSTEGKAGEFTDGHDYAGSGMIPQEGWEPVKPTVAVSVETLAALFRAVNDLKGGVDEVARPKKQGDRQDAARKQHWQIRTVESLICKASGNTHA